MLFNLSSHLVFVEWNRETRENTLYNTISELGEGGITHFLKLQKNNLIHAFKMAADTFWEVNPPPLPTYNFPPTVMIAIIFPPKTGICGKLLNTK